MNQLLPERDGALPSQSVAAPVLEATGDVEGSGVVVVAGELAGAVGSVVLGADGSGEVGSVLGAVGAVGSVLGAVGGVALGWPVAGGVESVGSLEDGVVAGGVVGAGVGTSSFSHVPGMSAMGRSHVAVSVTPLPMSNVWISLHDHAMKPPI